MSIECRVSVCIRLFLLSKDKQKTTPFREWSFERQSRLGERDIGGRRTLRSIGDLEGDGIADLELIVGDTYELLGVEEEILLHAIAGDEPESTFRERFDSSGHSVCFLATFREKSDYISSCINCKKHCSIEICISQYSEIELK